MSAPEVVPVHFDFASSVCFVAHRVMERLQPDVDALGVRLRWTPLDLVRLGPWRRGAPVPPIRLHNARRVADELGVAVAPLPVWPDSRRLNAAAILAEEAGREASWRERAFSAVFEEGRRAEDAPSVCALAAELGWRLDPDALDEAVDELERRTLRAAEDMVTGVPTFMLGRWPFGGIQTEDTMRRVLGRYAARARQGALA